MKGLKCKIYYYLSLVLFVGGLLAIFSPKTARAYNEYEIAPMATTSVTWTKRSMYENGSYYNQNISIPITRYPQDLWAFSSSLYTTPYGAEFEVVVPDDSSSQNKLLNIYFNFVQPVSQGYVNFYLPQAQMVAHTSTGDVLGTCDNGITEYGVYILYNCKASISNGAKITGYTFTMGTLNVPTGNPNGVRPITTICGTSTGTSCNAAFRINNVSSYIESYKGPQDTTNELLEDMLNKQDKTNELLEEQNERDQQDRDNFENTTDDGQNKAKEEGAKSEEQGTSLFQAFIELTNFLGNINSGSCELDMGEPYGFKIGKLNLCQYSPPTWVTTVATVIVGLAVAGLSYHLVRRMINIYRSFTNVR